MFAELAKLIQSTTKDSQQQGGYMLPPMPAGEAGAPAAADGSSGQDIPMDMDLEEALRNVLEDGGAASTAPGSTPSFFMDALSIILDRTACRII